MRSMLSAWVIVGALFFWNGVLAAEKSVTLAVERMTCASCPYIVRQALAGVPGVIHVEVSFEKEAAVVTFDDAETNVAALTSATTRAGFPSRLIEYRNHE